MKERFSNLLWMGGSPCSGKSSIAELLAEQYGLTLLHADELFAGLQDRITPAEHSVLHKWTHTPWDALWMQPQETLLLEVIQANTEQLALVLEELAARTFPQKTLVEGCSLLPPGIAGLLRHPTQGLWVVSDEDFLREHYRQRGPWVEEILHTCTNPEQAYRNWMDRDAAFGRWVIRQAENLDMRVLYISGRRSIAENAILAARHYGLDTTKEER